MGGKAFYRSQLHRWVHLDQQIRAGRYPNCSSFAAEWEVSPKTIQRDLAFFRDGLNAPLAYDRERRGYCYTEEGWSLPPVQLSQAEFLQLLVAERMAAQYEGTPLARTLEALFAKIQLVLPESISIDPSLVRTRFSFFGQPTRSISEAVWLPVFHGLHYGRVLRLSYCGFGRSEPEEREVEPVHLVCVGGEWYLVAHDLAREDLRHFAVSRIREAEELGRRARPHPFDAATYFSNRFGRFLGRPEEGSVEVAIRFDAATAHTIRERTWHPDQVAEEGEDGGLILRFPTPALYEVRLWVLQWGAGAEVLAPDELRVDVAREAGRLAALYRGDQEAAGPSRGA